MLMDWLKSFLSLDFTFGINHIIFSILSILLLFIIGVRMLYKKHQNRLKNLEKPN